MKRRVNFAIARAALGRAAICHPARRRIGPEIQAVGQLVNPMLVKDPRRELCVDLRRVQQSFTLPAAASG